MFRNQVACLSWEFITWWAICFLFVCFSLAIWNVFVGCYCSVTRLCLTLCDPMNCGTQGFPVLQCLQEFAQGHVHESMICKRLWKSRMSKKGKRPVTTGAKILHPCENSSLSSLLTIYSVLHYYILYLMLFVWLYWVLVVVCRIFIASCGIFHCGTWTSCGIWAH